MRSYLVPGIALMAFFIFVARPLVVLACVPLDRRARWTRQEIVFLMWCRETGVVPAALAGLLVSQGVKGADIVAAMVALAIIATLVVQAIISFLFFWNDLLWPLIVLSDRNKMTLTVGILFLSFRAGLGVYFAAGVLAALPAVLFYAAFNRRIIESVTTAGLAGRGT